MDICVVCLENNGEIFSRIDISSKKWKESNMQQIIQKHLWWWCLRQPINENHKQWICQQCWQDLTGFHQFAQRVKQAHKVYRVSLKKRIVQVYNEVDPIELVVPEVIDKEPNIVPPLTKIPKIRAIQTEEVNIDHIKKETNSDMPDYSQQESMFHNDEEEILPNLEYSITHLEDTTQLNAAKSESNTSIPNIKSLAEITFLLHQQNNLTNNNYMGITEIKKSIGNQKNAFKNILNNEITALKSSFQSHFESPKFTTLFPISSAEGLYAFENIITEENKSEIVSSVKRILGPKGIEKGGICNMFSYELVFEYNVNGIHGKKRLLDYEKTMNVLFLASADNNTSLVEFNVQLRKAIKSAKNRYFKAECMKRKRVNDPSFEIYEEEDNSQSVQNDPFYVENN